MYSQIRPLHIGRPKIQNFYSLFVSEFQYFLLNAPWLERRIFKVGADFWLAGATPRADFWLAGATPGANFWLAKATPRADFWYGSRTDNITVICNHLQQWSCTRLKYYDRSTNERTGNTVNTSTLVVQMWGGLKKICCCTVMTLRGLVAYMTWHYNAPSARADQNMALDSTKSESRVMVIKHIFFFLSVYPMQFFPECRPLFCKSSACLSCIYQDSHKGIAYRETGRKESQKKRGKCQLEQINSQNSVNVFLRKPK